MTTSDAPAVGRAGRNLPAAIGVGLGLGALVLGTLYSPARWAFVVVITAASVVGTLEVVRALRQLGAQPPVVPVLVGGTAMVRAAPGRGTIVDVFLPPASSAAEVR